MLPWVCHRTLAPAVGRGLRVTVAVALAAVGSRFLMTGAGADAFRRLAGRTATRTIDAAAGGLLPWVVYWTSLLATTLLVPVTAAKRSDGRSSVVGVAHGTVWGVMPVLVMLAGARGPLWGLLGVTQVACLVLAVKVWGKPVRLETNSTQHLKALHGFKP